MKTTTAKSSLGHPRTDRLGQGLLSRAVRRTIDPAAGRGTTFRGAFEPRYDCADLQEVSMSRTFLALSAAVLICASSQFALADENGAITGGVGGAVAGAVVGGPVGAVVGGVGGAAIGNSMTNHRHYHRGYARDSYHHHYDQY
jgi:hypothetical protein